jgi:hypothetical protein
MDRGLVDEKTSKETVKNVTLSSLRKVETKLLIPYSQMRERVTEASDDQKEVLEFILENLTPKKEQVAARGEVFTPLKLVEDMLDKLPADVWTHPEYRWLDPSNGIGNFPVVAFTKLFGGLAAAIPDENARKAHIVENMLFMVEIDKTNIQLSKKLLHKMCGNSECKINLLQHDFLTLTPSDMKTAFGFSDFHVAMGNPPYNPPKTESGSSGNSIWQNFVLKLNSLLVPGGYLCLIHPPGWKKPTEDEFDAIKFVDGVYTKQIRQGQVWQVLKSQGSFRYIYTNDQKSKTVEYFKHFPAVDYYVYQKTPGDLSCKTRNIFNGQTIDSESVHLRYDAPYLPTLITNETIEILTKATTVEGVKTKFTRFRAAKGFSIDPSKGSVKYIYMLGNKDTPKYQYSDKRDSNVDIDKVIMTFGGGIDAYNVKYISKDEEIGVVDKTVYSKVESEEEGRHLELFLKSDIVKFIFLITQYASGAITQNEPLVANSISIPPIEVTDYYEFFGLTPEHKSFIETTLALYNTFKAPKKKTEKNHSTPKRKPRSLSDTRKRKK